MKPISRYTGITATLSGRNPQTKEGVFMANMPLKLEFLTEPQIWAIEDSSISAGHNLVRPSLWPCWNAKESLLYVVITFGHLTSSFDQLFLVMVDIYGMVDITGRHCKLKKEKKKLFKKKSANFLILLIIPKSENLLLLPPLNFPIFPNLFDQNVHLSNREKPFLLPSHVHAVNSHFRIE